MSRIAISSLLVTVFTFLGLALTLLSKAFIAREFGASSVMDVYLAATTVPLFIATIASGALSVTFIPVLAEYRVIDPAEASNAASIFMNLVGVAAVVLCVLGTLAAEPIMTAVAPGFTPEKAIQSTELLRLFLPVIVLVALNEVLASIYYSSQRFILPSLQKILGPLVVIGCVWLFGGVFGARVLVLATLASTLLQTVVLILGLLSEPTFRYSLQFDLRHPAVRKILVLMAPLLLGMIVYRAVPLIDRFFLSRLPEGSISHIGYASQLMSALPSILVSGIALTMFPIQSAHAAAGEWDVLRAGLKKGVRMVAFLSVPVALLLGVYGRPLVQLTLEHGAFRASDTTAVFDAFVLYLLSLPVVCVGTLVGQVFYVLQQTRAVTVIGVGVTVLYGIVCALLTPRVGALAIPIAYFVYFASSVVVTTWIISQKLRFRLGDLVSFLVHQVLSAALAVGITFPLGLLVPLPLARCALCIGLGFGIYWTLQKRLFGAPEPAMLSDLLASTLREFGRRWALRAKAAS